jgi:hypothetical protein
MIAAEDLKWPIPSYCLPGAYPTIFEGNGRKRMSVESAFISMVGAEGLEPSTR